MQVQSRAWGEERKVCLIPGGFFSPLINNVFPECIGNAGAEHHEVALQSCLGSAWSTEKQAPDPRVPALHSVLDCVLRL